MRSLLFGLALACLTGCYASQTRGGSVDPDADAGPRADAFVRAPTCPGVSYPFSRDEVYLETTSAACGATRPACLVYQLEGNPDPSCTEQCADPAEARQRAFCTCRCDGPTPCACDADEVCAPTGFSFGSFCVPSAIAPRR